jgi:hypothetical protein
MHAPVLVADVDVFALDLEREFGLDQYRATHTEPLPLPAKHAAGIATYVAPKWRQLQLIEHNESAFTMPVSVAAWPGLGRAFGVAEGVA